MAFWESAFDDFVDNAKIIGAVTLDLAANLNPWSAVVDTPGGSSAGFLSGDAPLTAAEAERQNAELEGREYSQARVDASAAGGLNTVATATVATLDQAGDAVADTAKTVGKTAGRALDFFTTPWGITAGALGVVLVVIVLPAAVEGLVKK